MTFELLSNIWFFLLALVWGIYIAQEMFISGVGMISVSYLKEEKNYKFINRSVGTHWDGVQVWLILAVGGTFAAFPNAFAAILTGLYIPIFLLLYIIIIRGISIEVLDKTDNLKVKNILKKCWFVSSVLLLIVVGIYTTNMFIGLPLNKTGSMNDTFFSFLTIFNMLSIISAVMFILYAIALGALYLKLNCSTQISSKLQQVLKIVPLLAAIFLIFVLVGLNAKADIFNRGIFVDYIWLWALPISSVVFAVLGGTLSFLNKHGLAFAMMILGILLFVITGYISLMPNFVFSTINPEYSLSIADASAGLMTLKVMFFSTLIFLPIVLVYQGYKYVRFWKK